MIAVKILIVAGLFIIGPDLCQPMKHNSPTSSPSKPHTSVETRTRIPSPDQHTHRRSSSPPTQLPSSSRTGEGTNHETSKGSHVMHTDNHNLHKVLLPRNGAVPKHEIDPGLKSPRKGSVSPEKRPLLSTGKTASTTGRKPPKHWLGSITTGFTARNPANADGNGERKKGNKKEPTEKTPLLSKESWDSTGSTDTTSRPKLARGKGSSVRTFRPRPDIQQDSTASKPELPNPELPKPELPKPKLPEPELPKSKVPKPKLPMPKLPKKEIAATSMVDHGPDMSSEGSETDGKTPEEIEKEQRRQFRHECLEECWKSDGYIEVPASVVEGGNKAHFLTGKTTDLGKGMRPKCDCVINSALTWFLNEREEGAKKGDAFEQIYKTDRKLAAKWLEKQGFKVHYYPVKPTKLQRSPMVKGIRHEEEKPPTTPGNEGCHEKCQKENGYINNGTGTVHIAVGVIDDSGFEEICKCRANSGLKQIYLDTDEFSKFQSVFETNPQDIHTWSTWLLKKRLTVHWD